MGDVISKAESYSTANQHLLVKKLLLVILMIAIVDMVSLFFFFFFYNAFMNCSLGKKKRINPQRISLNSFYFSYFIL